MDKLIIALFETSIALIMFYLVFVLWLKRLTFFKENRFYLLLSAGFSLVIPWINFSLPSTSSTTIMVYNLIDVVSVSANGYEQSLIQTLSAWQWIFIVYALGVLVALGLFIINMIKITRIDRVSHSNFDNKLPKSVRFIKADVVPFSFLNKIYINPSTYSQKHLNDIIAHENVHINQQHTYDCLFYELLIVFFWFNPIVYKYRTSAKELHEYLADEGAIRSGIAEVEYQKLLFEQATGLEILSLPNSFNYSLIKRRLVMLTKIKSSKIARVRLLFVLPVLSVLVLVFSCNKVEKDSDTIVKENANMKSIELLEDQIFNIVETMPVYPGGELGLRKFITINVVYPEKAKKTGTEGKIYVQFVVNKQGEVEQVKHVGSRVPVKEKNSIGEVVVVSYTEVFDKEEKAYDELVAEAIRVVSSIPKWTPGEEGGKKVKVSFTVPINFALN